MVDNAVNVFISYKKHDDSTAQDAKGRKFVKEMCDYLQGRAKEARGGIMLCGSGMTQSFNLGRIGTQASRRIWNRLIYF